MNKEAIKSALSAIRTGNFLEKSEDLLATIGYQSERTLELSGTVHDFFEEFPPLNPNTKTEQEFRKHAESVKLVFQFTSDEITDDIQQRLFESDGFDKGNIKSFLFCTVELKDNNYSHEPNTPSSHEKSIKGLFAPTVILFRTAESSDSRICRPPPRQNRRGPRCARTSHPHQRHPSQQPASRTPRHPLRTFTESMRGLDGCQ